MFVFLYCFDVLVLIVYCRLFVFCIVAGWFGMFSVLFLIGV